MSIDRDALNSLRIDRPARRPGPGRTSWLIAAGLLLAVIAVAGWAFTRDRAIEVTVAPARAIAGSTPGAVLNASGYVTARRQATVSSKITGKIAEVFIEEGMV
ncbi:MAG: efflux RND transporter periplasmic adaptor subunit, partial [Thermoanaerobaculia bacterium]